MQSEAAINNHERFEELAALALIGEVSAHEYQELQTHLKSCQACRQEYRGFEEVLSQNLPLLHQERSAVSVLRKHDSVEELSIRERVGTPPRILRSSQPHKDLSPANVLLASSRIAFIPYAVAAILVVALAMFSFEMHQQSMKTQGEAAALKDKLSSLNRELQNRPTIVISGPPRQLKEILPEREDQSARLIQRTRDLEQQLNASAEEIDRLRDQLQSAQASDKTLAQNVSDAQAQMERVSAELQAALRDRDQTSDNLKNKETELIALEQEIGGLRESVGRDRALLAASYDITNLMGARNLRIIDVSDVDGKGKTRKAFGRVFFTEGMSLVFYAFDLTDTKSSPRPASFQAWGSQGANLPAAQSLGIFFHDDRNTNRWVLKFDDPRVLSEIDSVFVTVEPLGGSKKPTGTPLLPAYLKAELNHP